MGLNADDEKDEDSSSVKWNEWRTWPVVIKQKSNLYSLWELTYVIILLYSIVYEVP